MNVIEANKSKQKGVSTVLPLLAGFMAIGFCLVHDQSYSYRWFLVSFCVLLLMVCSIFGTSYSDAIVLPKMRSMGFYTGFMFWSIASLTWTPVLGDSVLTLLVFLVLPMAFILAFNFSDTQQRLFSKVLIVILLVASGQTVWQALVDVQQRPTGLFSDWNSNGGYMAMLLLPICSRFLVAEHQNNRSIFLGLVIAVSALAIGFTLSRGAVLGLSVGLGLLLFVAWRQKVHLTAIGKLLLYIAAGFVVSDVLNQGWNESTLFDRMVDTQTVEGASNGRISLWKAGWAMYTERPVLGWGLDMFHWLFPQYRDPMVPDLGQFAHNDYFQFLIELGPLGFVLFVGFLVSIVIENARLYKQTKKPQEALTSFGYFSGCVVLFTQSLVNFNLYQASFTIMLGFYLGILAKQQVQTTVVSMTELSVSTVLSKSGYYGFLSLIALIPIVWSTLLFFSLKVAYETVPNATPLTVIDKLQTAQKLLPYREEYLASFAHHVSIMLSDNVDSFNANDIHILTTESLKQLDRAIKKNPYRSINFNNKAQLLIRQSTSPEMYRNNEISVAYQQALVIDPDLLKTRTEFAYYLGSIDQKQKALDVMEMGLDRTYYENYQVGIDFLKLLLLLHVQLGHQDKVSSLENKIDELMEMTKNDKNNIRGAFFISRL